MKENIVVLFAGHYSVVDDQTKERNDGISVSYIFGSNFSPLMNADNSHGRRPAKASLKTDQWDKIVSAPGLYEGTFEMAIGSNGKPTLKLVDVDWLSNVELDVLGNPPVKAAGGSK